MYLYIRFYANQLACGSTLDADLRGVVSAIFGVRRTEQVTWSGDSGGVLTDGGLAYKKSRCLCLAS